MSRASRSATAKSANVSVERINYDPKTIEIWNAEEHNLKVPHLSIPKGQLVVFTGPSGSGKSSLAFDTLYAEGQRRYVESLSAYARQFLGRLDRPKVEKISGLTPTIAIEQKSASNNPRSTVGTITEVYDYLRVLYARAGTQYCTECDQPVDGQSVDQIIKTVFELEGDSGSSGKRVQIWAPIARNRKGEFKDEIERFRQQGFTRVRLDGTVSRIEELPPIDKKAKHDFDVLVDRTSIESNNRSRLSESIELALKEGAGEVLVEPEGGTPRLFSEKRQCCGISYPELSPQSFSFNSPLGMCTACNGLGTRLEIDPELLIQPDLSIREGAIRPWATSVERGDGWTFRIIEAMAQATKVNLDSPWKKLAKSKQDQILYGLEGKKIQVNWGTEGQGSHGTFGMQFKGVIPTLMKRLSETASERMREHYRQYFREMVCDQCQGRRLRKESLSVRIGIHNLAQFCELSVEESTKELRKLPLSPSQKTIAAGAVREIESRLRFLVNVGLDYLTLNRSGPTLSGGEAQRIRLASQLGSELSGVTYVLDEPSIGLHAKDNQRLISTLQHLRDIGNSVVVVEHDEETIMASDFLVDFGPGAGHLGGHIVFAGPPSELHSAEGPTADFLSGRRAIETPKTRRKPKDWITVHGASEQNLKNLTVRFPTGCLTAVTGVSGAGKSSLVNRILLPALAKELHGSTEPIGRHKKIEGLSLVDKVIAIDQKPIGRTPRSNPGTYSKAFDEIREIFASLPEAKTRGFTPARFSFNVKGGRCESCQGDGVTKVEMHFLSDVYVPCDVCAGKRYNEATLEVVYRGKNIHQILETSVEECAELFSAFPSLSRILATLIDVGLGYMKLGQPATTLSGGEAQRVKLAKELARVQTGKTLYVLDEPTTGLHFVDIERLLIVLERLVKAGNSVVVIEHNLDVVRCADWIIDLGPMGGAGGGQLIAEGTPEAVAKVQASDTGKFLKSLLSAPSGKSASSKPGSMGHP